MTKAKYYSESFTYLILSVNDKELMQCLMILLYYTVDRFGGKAIDLAAGILDALSEAETEECQIS